MEFRTTNNYIVKIDDEDINILLSSPGWFVDNVGYVKPTKLNMKTHLHRLIMKPPPGMRVDHINMDKLDNRKENMRLATQSQNMANRGPQKNNTSGYKGVSWDKARKKWSSCIKVHGVIIHLGRFVCPVAASEAYTKASIQYFGDFARTTC
jgi:hypothetical protein